MTGRPLRRVEDRRLVTGAGRYVDDLTREGTAHAVFVRSTEAHARLRSIDTAEAARAPFVLGVFTAADLGFDQPMPNLFPAPVIINSFQAFPLARDEVCYVGEPVAVVVAEDRRAAVDAAELVVVDYEILDAIVHHDAALDPQSPLAHADADSNLVAQLKAAYGDVDGAFSGADRVVRVTVRQHRGACASMEPRGVMAHHDDTVGQLIVWSSTQSPYPLRRHLSDYLAVPLQEVRVIAPDVGGGFGPKASLYAEEYVVAALARRTGRPVKWVESRREHFTTTLQQRDQTCELEAAVDADGTLRGVRARIVHDNGAYVPYGVVLPATGLQLLPGPYVIPALDVKLDVVYTNLTPTSPIRGAGRPYAVFAMERLIDGVARELGIDRAEVRRRNFIPADQFPYELPMLARDGSHVTYDSGDYHTALEKALEAADAGGFEERRRRAAGSGKLLGLGIASYVEDTGLGPFEGARVEVLPSGEVVVATGAASQGQGHATVFAQLCAQELGVDPVQVTVRAADSDYYGYGISTVASRTAVMAGSSVHLAAAKVAALAKKLAAGHLEAAEADLVLEDGMVKVAGQPGAEVSLGELARLVQGTAAVALPPGITPGLAADEAFQLVRPAYAFGTHVAEVEVDSETGLVTVLRYTVAHDCGTVLNPMIVDGQIDGGVAHGLGNALMERVSFSDEGQPLVTTFMDYRVLTAAEMPPLVKVHTETPSPLNPLGVKGAGEGGTLPAAAAVASAVEDALAGRGVVVDRHPLTPETVRRLIESGGGA